jgi:hypothetical protein
MKGHGPIVAGFSVLAGCAAPDFAEPSETCSAFDTSHTEIGPGDITAGFTPAQLLDALDKTEMTVSYDSLSDVPAEDVTLSFADYGVAPVIVDRPDAPSQVSGRECVTGVVMRLVPMLTVTIRSADGTAADWPAGLAWVEASTLNLSDVSLEYSGVCSPATCPSITLAAAEDALDDSETVSELELQMLGRMSRLDLSVFFRADLRGDPNGSGTSWGALRSGVATPR